MPSRKKLKNLLTKQAKKKDLELTKKELTDCVERLTGIHGHIKSEKNAHSRLSELTRKYGIVPEDDANTKIKKITQFYDEIIQDSAEQYLADRLTEAQLLEKYKDYKQLEIAMIEYTLCQQRTGESVSKLNEKYAIKKGDKASAREKKIARVISPQIDIERDRINDRIRILDVQKNEYSIRIAELNDSMPLTEEEETKTKLETTKLRNSMSTCLNQIRGLQNQLKNTTFEKAMHTALTEYEDALHRSQGKVDFSKLAARQIKYCKETRELPNLNTIKMFAGSLGEELQRTMESLTQDASSFEDNSWASGYIDSSSPEAEFIEARSSISLGQQRSSSESLTDQFSDASKALEELTSSQGSENNSPTMIVRPKESDKSSTSSEIETAKPEKPNTPKNS